MSPDKYKLTESAYIGEELFSDADYELQRQCASVRHAEERKIMSRERALKEFEVSPQQYTAYLARNTSQLLIPASTAYLSFTESVIVLRVMSANLTDFANHQDKKVPLKHLSAALRAMKKLTDEAENHAETQH